MLKHNDSDIDNIIEKLKHLLPSQQALRDFVHHNPLHSFQHLKFYEAIFKAKEIFGYQVHLQLSEYRELYKTGRIKKEILLNLIAAKKGQEEAWNHNLLEKKYDINVTPRVGLLRKNWKSERKINLEDAVHPLLFRILCAFLDQGIAINTFPVVNSNFTDSLKTLENKGVFSFFKTKKIKQLFLSGDYTIRELLKRIVGNDAYYEQYLFDQQFCHPGWSGFVAAVEDNPQTLLSTKQIRLEELIAFELLLELDNLNEIFGDNWLPLCHNIKSEPIEIMAKVPSNELSEVIELWQTAFEWSYYDSVLKGILISNEKTKMEDASSKTHPSMQAIFCIDEREDSFRRHIEAVDKQSETFGAPGFFGVEFYFLQQGSKFYDKLCPAPVTPKFVIKESGAVEHNLVDPIYTNLTHGMFSGFVLSILYGFWAFFKKFFLLFSPKMSPAISNAFAHMDSSSTLTIENKNVDDVENGLQIGYTIEEMADRAESFLKNIGLVINFAPIVYLVSHGSSSANNPHHGAHDCGACSGRPGATNARVQAYILNHNLVRKILERRNIFIPPSTQFTGCMHDTAADVLIYYDTNIFNNANLIGHEQNKQHFELALNLNAKERSRRFASINTKKKMEQVRKEILKRSVSLFEPRPELGHGTNSIAFVGRRQTTKGIFLDRRAFLNSYDYSIDPSGEILTAVMRPIGLVCGGINLEYYFSRVDNIKLGAGTKLPHNVMGLFGVANSSDGDLRPGLPWQMIEVHDPLRLLVIVEQVPDIVLKAIQSTKEIYGWYINEWVHLLALHPIEKVFYYFKDGSFIKYIPITHSNEIGTIKNLEIFIENAKEMETNHIVHATEENLPVYLLD